MNECYVVDPNWSYIRRCGVLIITIIIIISFCVACFSQTHEVFPVCNNFVFLHFLVPEHIRTHNESSGSATLRLLNCSIRLLFRQLHCLIRFDCSARFYYIILFHMLSSAQLYYSCHLLVLYYFATFLEQRR